jgi:hypothetical protein
MFFRSAGSAVGVAVSGALVNATLGTSGVDGDSVDPHALTTAVHSVFLATTALAGVMLAGVLLVPRDRGTDGGRTPQTVRPAKAAAR